jgi:hypothetical protein
MIELKKEKVGRLKLSSFDALLISVLIVLLINQ